MEQVRVQGVTSEAAAIASGMSVRCVALAGELAVSEATIATLTQRVSALEAELAEYKKPSEND